MSDTKEYIIDQAYSLFLNHSYEGVSISDISKAIGFTKGALYHHFASKKDLFAAVIDKYLVITETSVTDTTISLADYIETLVAHAESVINSILKESEAFMPINYISLMIDALRHYPEFNTHKETLFSSEIEKIKNILENAVKVKEIRSDIDISIMACNLFSLGYGVAVTLLQSNSPKKSISLLKAQLLELYKILKL